MRCSAPAALALALAAGACAAVPTDPPVLDGEAKSFVVVGYSTSYAWPGMLQDMLDEHSEHMGGERVYHVLNAVRGGSPVEIWIGAPGSADYEATFGPMLRDYFGPDARLLGDAPQPTVALLQQSLQFTRTRRGPIPDASDVEGIEIGAAALGELVDGLHDAGIEHVYVAMHIYKVTVEPEVGNERLALAALLAEKIPYLEAGPDVWEPTRAAYPAAFAEDRIHPNQLGMKIMAAGWYRALAGEEAREVIVEHMVEREYDVDEMMREYRTWRWGIGR